MGGGPAVISGHYAFLPGANIYDISDPGTPVFMSYIGAALDIAVLDHYAYLVTTGDSSGTNGFYVFDFSNPASPTNVAVMGASGSLITIAGNYAYVMAYGRGGGNIKILDISNRTNPVLVNTISAWIYGMTSSGNYLYLVAGSLDIYDVSNPTNTLKAASVGLGFNSQGYAITVSRNYAYIAQTDRIAIYDLGRPAPPQLSINPTSTNTLVISWPTPNPAFAVQQSAGLPASNWVTLTNVPIVVASKNQVILPAPTGTMFYRLVSQ